MSSLGTITRRDPLTGVNRSDVQVSKDAYNDSLIMAGGSNGNLLVRDNGNPDGWGWTADPAVTSLSAISSTGTAAVQAINNGGGFAVQGVVNSGVGIAVGGSSVSTTQPAVLGVSTGYYAALFFNVTDLGSNLANAQAIGLVAQSAYSNAFYAQQGEVSIGLDRDNIYPGTYLTRVCPALNGHDFTKPILTVEETTAAGGGLFELIAAGGIQKVLVDKDGAAFFADTLTVAGTLAVNGSSLVPAAGTLIFWNGRAVMDSPADAKWRLTNNAQTAGFLFECSVDAIVKLRNRAGNGGAAFELLEQTAPSAAPSDGVRVYAEDNGSGKTRLMAIFSSGAAQQIAIQP